MGRFWSENCVAGRISVPSSHVGASFCCANPPFPCSNNEIALVAPNPVLVGTLAECAGLDHRCIKLERLVLCSFLQASVSQGQGLRQSIASRRDRKQCRKGGQTNAPTCILVVPRCWRPTSGSVGAEPRPGAANRGMTVGSRPLKKPSTFENELQTSRAFIVHSLDLVESTLGVVMRPTKCLETP
jgi:hypothetical protein